MLLPRRVGRVASGTVLLFVLLAACAPAVRRETAPPPAGLVLPPLPASVAVGNQLRLVNGLVPFPFEVNRGQAPSEVAFLLRAGPMRVGLASGGPRFHLLAGSSCSDGSAQPATTCDTPASEYTLRLELIGAAGSQPLGTVPAETTVNYLVGSPGAWLTDVPTFQQVSYREAWPGIDVRFERASAGVEMAYVLGSGADPGQIRLAWHGAERARLAEDGALVLTTPLGTLRESAPVAWQDTAAGNRQPVSARFELVADGTIGGPVEVGLRLGAYDPSRPLIVDPVLTYSTYLGGNSSDAANAMVVDSDRNAYVAGSTRSTSGISTPGTFQAAYAGDALDAFVVKLNPSDTELVYATYLGGTNAGSTGTDSANAIAVSAAGEVYLTGNTDALDFPTTAGVLQTTNGGQSDAFVSKLNASGSTLVYSTYLGGAADDIGNSIAVDGAGNAYVAGLSRSPDFPTTLSGFQTIAPGDNDAFVVKLNPTASTSLYSTYLGGSGADQATSLALGGGGDIFVTGNTNSNNFPTTGGAFQTSLAGMTDVIVARLNPALSGTSSLIYSTYLGGGSGDGGNSIAVDSGGRAYITGPTTSANFPTTSGAFQTTRRGVFDAFVVRLSSGGSSLASARFLVGAETRPAAQSGSTTSGTRTCLEARTPRTSR